MGDFFMFKILLFTKKLLKESKKYLTLKVASDRKRNLKLLFNIVNKLHTE